MKEDIIREEPAFENKSRSSDYSEKIEESKSQERKQSADRKMKHAHKNSDDSGEFWDLTDQNEG